MQPHYTTKRMLDDYINQYYKPLHERIKALRVDSFDKAIELSDWKKFVASEWEAISTIESNFHQIKRELVYGDKPIVDLKLHIGNLRPEDIGVEIVAVRNDLNNKPEFILTKELELISQNGSTAEYRTGSVMTTPGTFNYAIRVYPKNALLPHRQSFCYTKWL